MPSRGMIRLLFNYGGNHERFCVLDVVCASLPDKKTLGLSVKTLREVARNGNKLSVL